MKYSLLDTHFKTIISLWIAGVAVLFAPITIL